MKLKYFRYLKSTRSSYNFFNLFLLTSFEVICSICFVDLRQDLERARHREDQRLRDVHAQHRQEVQESLFESFLNELDGYFMVISPHFCLFLIYATQKVVLQFRNCFV